MLTSVLAKVFESLVLTRLQYNFSVKGIPHLNQKEVAAKLVCISKEHGEGRWLSVFHVPCEYDLRGCFCRDVDKSDLSVKTVLVVH